MTFLSIVSDFLPFLHQYLFIIHYRERHEVTTASTFVSLRSFLSSTNTWSLSSIERRGHNSKCWHNKSQGTQTATSKEDNCLNCFLPFGPWTIVHAWWAKNRTNYKIHASRGWCKMRVTKFGGYGFSGFEDNCYYNILPNFPFKP